MLQQNLQELKLKTLKHFWGYDAFHPQQEDIIDSIISGKDTLALLPTGGGKSLCYQLPALLLEGTALIVSPLLALIRDQVLQLKNYGIEAEYLSSELDDFEAEKIYSRCKEGFTKLLYISPERLKNPVFLQNIQEFQISFLAVDEAHCISEWGADFRPSYQNIKRFREQHLPNVPSMALTATATAKVLEEIRQKVGLKNPYIFKKSFARNNIKINILEISDKYQWVSDFLKSTEYSGIIYARTRKETEQLSEYLKNKGYGNVDFFHAGLATKEKIEKQNLWLKSNNRVLIATNAFGMGIDKDNVRFVVHFSVPPSIENYYQEIGRAGRDGAESYAVLLWSQQEISNTDALLLSQIPTRKEFLDIADYLFSILSIGEGDLPEETFQLDLDKLKKLSKVSLGKIKNTLNFLHNQEVIYYKPTKGKSSVKLNVQYSEVDLLSKKDSYFVELLLRTLPGLNTQKSHFNEVKVAAALGIDLQVFCERIRDLKSQNIIEYLDGNQSSVKFLVPRDSRSLAGKYWALFEQIQKNKLQKWEEIKYFIQDQDFCKTRMILSYFGEKVLADCKKCYVCERENHNIFQDSVPSRILNVLAVKPSTIEEISFQLNMVPKEDVLESLILLLDSDKIKMLDFRTYSLS